MAECAIKTKQGTKVADVAWASNSLLAIVENEIECSVAPEICIEVLSFSNTEREITEKKEIYFEQGAMEFWLCYSLGNISFFSQEAEVERSLIAKKFPKRV